MTGALVGALHNGTALPLAGVIAACAGGALTRVTSLARHAPEPTLAGLRTE